MKKPEEFDAAEEAQEFKRLGIGGYVCTITAAADVPIAESGKGDYLKLEYDIAEGEFKNYYTDLFNNKNFWGGNFIRSYKQGALPFFKAFVTALENSNGNYTFDWNEKNLVGKKIGLVLAEEEYPANDGNIKTRLYVCQTRSVDVIRKGDFKIPDKKCLPKTQNIDVSLNDTDADAPF